jgi:hypothetical protein
MTLESFHEAIIMVFDGVCNTLRKFRFWGPFFLTNERLISIIWKFY